MKSEPSQDHYRVWATDNLIYGPIDLGTLVQWVQENRVLPETWLHSQRENVWRLAREMTALRRLFSPGIDTAFLEAQVQASHDVQPEELRQFSLFSALSNAELRQLVTFGELRQAQPREVLLRKGDPGDALYFVLSGEVRARLVVGLEDRTLGRIPAGEFFGEMAMFTQAPRSADVVVEQPTRLLRMSSAAFQVLIKELPALAAPVLFAMARMMATRISEDNQRFQREVASEFVWR